MRRFFVRPEQITGACISLTGAEAHHVRSVLRLRPGQVVEFFDGTGTVYHSEILRIQSSLIEGRIVRRYVEQIADPFPLTLAQVVLKGRKMDLIVQKATELGVATLLPLISRYCEPGRNIENRIARWQRIVIEGCKQCGRAMPMQISPIMSLEDIITADYSYPVCCWEKEEQSLLRPGHLTTPGSVLLLIGPEGGFHEKEMEWVYANNFRIVTLGMHVLRAETAALAATSIVKYLSSLTAQADQNN